MKNCPLLFLILSYLLCFFDELQDVWDSPGREEILWWQLDERYRDHLWPQSAPQDDIYSTIWRTSWTSFWFLIVWRINRKSTWTTIMWNSYPELQVIPRHTYSTSTSSPSDRYDVIMVCACTFLMIHSLWSVNTLRRVHFTFPIPKLSFILEPKFQSKYQNFAHLCSWFQFREIMYDLGVCVYVWIHMEDNHIFLYSEWKHYHVVILDPVWLSVMSGLSGN